MAQGLLDHMHSVVDPTQGHQRRELGDLRLLHSIEPQPAQAAAQQHSKGTTYQTYCRPRGLTHREDLMTCHSCFPLKLTPQTVC